MLEQEAKIQRGKLDAMVVKVRPVLDCIDMEVAPQPDDRLPRLNTINDRCKAAWENFCRHENVLTHGKPKESA